MGIHEKGFWRYRLSCLLHYIHYLSNSRDDISQTLFVNSPVPVHAHPLERVRAKGSSPCNVGEKVQGVEEEPKEHHRAKIC